MEQDRKKLTLEEARKVINEQDAIILEAFEKRMAAAKEVVRNKIEAGTPIYVPAREQEILDRIASQAPEELSEYAVQLYQKLMEVSRAYQNGLRKFGLLGRKLGTVFLRRFIVSWLRIRNPITMVSSKWNRRIWKTLSVMVTGRDSM